MKPLLVLLAAFVISLMAIKISINKYDVAFAAVIAMSVMLLFTSMAHFAFTKGMAMMIPNFIPFKKELVYLTGIIEIAAATGLLIPHFRILTAWWLILFFVVLLPANINAAIRHIDYQKGTFTGAGTNYLWFRVPLQILFILWVYFAAIRVW
jgi:uncharacterized membrane protein